MDNNILKEPNKSKSAFQRRVVILNEDLDEEVERVRKILGMSRSGFIRYSILRMLEELNVLSTKVHSLTEKVIKNEQ